jgi:hypothetical protein
MTRVMVVNPFDWTAGSGNPTVIVDESVKGTVWKQGQSGIRDTALT